MSDPLTRAKRYRQNAAECCQLAGIETDEAIITDYKRISDRYIQLAEAEEKLAAELYAPLKRA